MAPVTPAEQTLRFHLRGQPGRVHLTYQTNDDPARWGYPLLGLGDLTEASRGFPVLQADVEYAAEGYAAILAWIQIVRITDLDAGDHELIVDGPPQLSNSDVPYITFGIRPTLFDAPAMSTAKYPNVDWDAQSTLVACPDCVMTRRVQRVCSFGWGYRIRGGRIQPTPLRTLGQHAWNDDLAVLYEQYPSWNFE